MVPGAQEKYNIPKLSFVRGVTGKNDLGLKGECCPDVPELRGHVSFEFKRIDLQAGSWGPGSQVSGFLELGKGWEDPRVLGAASAAAAGGEARP